MDNPLDHVIVEIHRISEAGPKDRFWPVVFIGGCNLRCPYCLNSAIVKPSSPLKHILITEVLQQLYDWGEEGVMISGGEPCMPSPLYSIMDVVIMLSAGRKVGISTNGTWPTTLKALIDSKKLSYVALDCKLNPNCRKGDFGNAFSICEHPFDYHSAINHSMSLISDWHQMEEDAQSEIRTTLYPPLINDDDLIGIGSHVHKRSSWVLQQYRKNTMFDGLENPVDPYPEEKVQEMLKLAQAVCLAKVEMRWP